MDLSLKKHEMHLSTDIPQDLTVKKSRSSAEAPNPLWASKPVSHHADKSRVTSLVEKPKTKMNPKPRMVPTLIEQNSRIIPDLDQYIRAMMDLKPGFSDPHLRSLALHKAKMLASQTSKPVPDVRSSPHLPSPSSLVVPTRSSLVIPKPRHRTQSDKTSKPQIARTETNSQKSLTVSPKTSHKVKSQLFDLKQRPHISHTITERLLSHDLHPNPVDKHNHTFLPVDPLYKTSTHALSTPSENHEVASQKRRRKQECPRKRIKMETQLPEPADPIFEINEEFLDKVTDAAQNGELSRGLDEYFGQTTEELMELNPEKEAGEVRESPSVVLTSQSQDRDDSNLTDDSASRASSDGLSPTPSSQSHPKQSRVAVNLQNREQRKVLRLYGKEYTTPSGKTYPQRQVRPKDCSRCRYNCSTSITPEQRQIVFDHFWSLDSYVKRLYYYCQSIKEKPAKTMKHTRECSREYTLFIEGERVRVCKGFYLATLDVSDKAVRIAMEKRKRGKGMWDKRGAHPPHNKTRPEDKDRVRSHIESYVIQDIYSKTGSSPDSEGVPGQDLNISNMYLDYAEGSLEDGKEIVSEDVYRKTFNAEYNLSSVLV